MAQSEKIFRDLLCERRSHPVETTDPAGARTIDELKRQLRDVRAELESERVKSRQLVSQCEKDVRRVREEGDLKLSASLEALSVRKEQERAVDVHRVEERLKKEWESERRVWEREKMDELARAQRKWQHDRDEDVRRSVRDERERCYKEMADSMGQDEALAKEDKLTRELFVLSQHNVQLDDQVYNLSRENKNQIEQMRRMKHDHENEIADVIRQHKNEASRDYAQLHLAEQIIAEKEQDLHLVESRAERDRMEKDQLVEEVAAIKSIKNVSLSELSESVTASPPLSRRSMGGASGVLQRRIEELEASVKKVEEEKSTLKFENASLRKRLVQESPGDGRTGSKDTMDERMRKLRKRNAELVTLVKTLDEKCKGFKSDYEQLAKSGSNPTDSEQQLRKSLNRQHAKDIMDYTKQIHAKDREIGDLRRRVAKLEVTAKPQVEPAPELEKKIRTLALDKLRMEKLIVKLCSKIPDEDDNSTLSRSEVECEAACVEALDLENQSLKKELAELHKSVAQGDEVDSPVRRSEVNGLNSEIKKLRKEVDRLANYESETISLRQSLDHAQSANSDLEQRCHVLSQQLEVSRLAVQELQSNSNNDHVTLLEGEVEKAKEEVLKNENKIKEMQEACDRATSELSTRDEQIATLMRRIEASDDLISDKEVLCQQLQARLDNVQQPHESLAIEVGVQTDNPSVNTQSESKYLSTPSENRVKSETVTTLLGREKVKSPIHRDVARIRSSSPKTSVVSDPLDSSLDHEMKAVGVELTDPYDSSECVGFSDTNLDDTHDSTHSVESIDREKSNERLPLQLSTQSHDTVAPPPLVPVVEQITEQLSRVEEIKNEKEESGDEDTDADPFHQTPDPPSQDNYTLYIAKFSYNPSEQSPNPTFDLELPLKAGDYLYVYGDVDGDGFYSGRLASGQTGLVPSNFVEKVLDGREEAPPPPRSQQRRLSNLQDIEEVDEDVSSADSLASAQELAPPTNLEVEKQFVDGGDTSVALRWDSPLPRPLQVTGYNVYLNGTHKMFVSGSDERTALVSGVPMTQLVRITVRTVSEGGESPDNATPILLNPQYPDPPHNILLSVSDSPTSLLVHFSPSPHTHTAVTSYTLHLNTHSCTQLHTTESTAFQETICALILPKDVLHLENELNSASFVQLTISAHCDEFESIPSLSVPVSREHITHLLLGAELESSVSSSVSSNEGERERYSPAKREEDLQLIQTTKMESSNGDHVIQDNNHVTNGVAEKETECVDDSRKTVRYYFRAQYSYDPHYQSPNEEGLEEELAFSEGDVITCTDEVGEDGFLDGTCNGRSGLVPSNMVIEITDPQELSQIKLSILNSNDGSSCVNGRDQAPPLDDSPRMMRAVHDYDPTQDSPNDQSEVELTFSEGDLITVFGRPDEDGFWQAELKGKKGIVPHNFLEQADNEPASADVGSEGSSNSKLIIAQDLEGGDVLDQTKH